MDNSQAQMTAFLTTYFIVLGVILIVSIAIKLFVWWKIFSKAGYSGALSLLLVFIPLAELVLLFYLALAEWPVLQELAALRRGPGFGGYPQQPPAGPGYPQPPVGPGYPSYPQQ
jgi:hypothetical protein